MKKLAPFIFFLALFTNDASAITTKDVFMKYKNDYFIESGSHKGDGIQMALDAGFSKIYSVELAPHFYQLCKKRFSKNKNVVVLEGDSSKEFDAILAKIDAPATFWLDGHYSWGELDAIMKHSIKNHTILIDDVRQFGTVEFDFLTLDQIIQKIREINPKYAFSFEDGYVKNDVLVAQVMGE
jgi:hypothetical protein